MKQLSRSGFTLVEVLVAVTAVSILAVVGITRFFGTTSSGQDLKRRADIDAIATTYEQGFDQKTGLYSGLSDTDFNTGKIPTPPNPGESYSGLIAPGSTASSFNICATLSDGDSYCKSSQQVGSTAPTSSTKFSSPTPTR